MSSRINQVLLIAVLLLSIAGCGIRNISVKTETELEYTVVKAEDIPQEIADIIAQKKLSEFQMSYQREDYLYILRGYGLQNSGGYSIQVKKLVTTGEAIYFQTELLGPLTQEQQQNVSYPYIVIKTKLRDEPVVFE